MPNVTDNTTPQERFNHIKQVASQPRMVKCENWLDCRAKCEHAGLHEFNLDWHHYRPEMTVPVWPITCGYHYCSIADAMIKCQEPTPKK